MRGGEAIAGARLGRLLRGQGCCGGRAGDLEVTAGADSAWAGRGTEEVDETLSPSLALCAVLCRCQDFGWLLVRINFRG